MKILDVVNSLNIYHIILFVLILISSFLYLYTNGKRKLFPIFVLGYLVIFLLSLNYLTSVFNNIFSFNYVSIRLYLIILIITNIIALITINCEISLLNKIINAILFICCVMLFGLNVLLLINSVFSLVDISVSYIVYLIDINAIIFVFYLYISFGVYIFKTIFNEVSNRLVLLNYKRNKEQVVESEPVSVVEENVNFDNQLRVNIFEDNKDNLLSDNNKFIIDGKDCSVIFKDTNRENVIKNYYILLTDVNARLINGYTIDENIRINNILNKLNIKDLDTFNLMNMDILSKITIDEYNLLKGFLDNYNH